MLQMLGANNRRKCAESPALTLRHLKLIAQMRRTLDKLLRLNVVKSRLNQNEMKELVRGYYSRHGLIPSLAVLAEMWGYASKSSASSIVATFIDEGFLTSAAGRRLTPGPTFHAKTGSDMIEGALAYWTKTYPGRSVRGYDVTLRLLHLAKSIDAAASRACAKDGITFGEQNLMDALLRMGPPYSASPTALKPLLTLSLAGVGKRVDRLVELGLVDRVPDEHDGRSMLVRLTERGRALLQRRVEHDEHQAHIQWAIELDPAEHNMLIDILRKAQNRIDQSLAKEVGQIDPF